jgi:cytochrome bd-type quinol oxidase subunit 1
MAFLDKIVQALGGAVSAVIFFVANAWDVLPVGVQKVLRDIVVGVVASVGALNLALPHNTTEATAEALLITTTVVYTVAGIVRREVWPLVINWVLSKLGFSFDYNDETDREFLK